MDRKSEVKMIIDSKKYNGPCECGRQHEMFTKFCIVERGCLADIDRYIAENGLCGYSVAVYDENTYNAEGLIRPLADKEIILPAKDLHADDHGVALLMERLPESVDYLIAVGSGTIHDIVRYSAYEKGIDFVSCPTAASVDGFCSSVAAMTWHGFKKTLTAVAPRIVVADLNVITKAPLRLARSGFGDMVGKYIALSDWRIASLLTGEYFCQKIYDITESATKKILDSAGGIVSGDTEAYEALTVGLLMSGLAMQLLGNSRCASGAEHHISHIIEMRPEPLGLSSDALHGEKVGVGSLIAIGEYHRIAELSGIEFCDYPAIPVDYIESIFGDRLSESIINENEKDAAASVTKEMLEQNFEGIREIINDIPKVDELVSIYKSIGALTTLSDIGVSEDKREELVNYSPLVRNRITLMRLRRAMKNI